MSAAREGRATLAALVIIALLAWEGCQRCGAPSAATEVVAYTSVDQVFSEPVFRAFEEETGIKVRAVYDTEETKRTGVLNRLIAERTRPRADLFWSGDPVRPFALIGRGMAAPIQAKALEGIPDTFRAADRRWAGCAARARVLLVNSKLVPADQTPTSIKALIDPRFKGKAAMANPLFGTTTMHVAALFSTWGEARARRLMKQIKANGVRVAASNGEVKRLVVAGEVALGLTDTDDANEALKAGAAVRVVYPDQQGIGALVMPTTVLILRGGPNPAPAQRLAAYLLSAAVEERMASAAAHMPLRAGIKVPKGVRTVESIRAMKLDYGKVAAEMERQQTWLRRWAGL